MVQFGVESENGWRPARAGDDILEWITVPGTNPPVRLQLMKGWPLQIMRAFAADYNANVEHLRDPDSAAFTPTNKVDTSNHLNGTAMDLNWNGADGRTFRLGISEAQAYPGEEAANLRALLDFYEGMIYCGGNWDIRDWMHFQMGGNTWNNPRTQDFIDRKIRADGFSTYRRNATPPPPLPPQESYGVPAGSSIDYGAPGFPPWVYQLGQAFNLRASTYPGHQETDRIEAGFARNPQHLNRGIDWAGPAGDMQRFAEYCLSIRGSLEQVIWQNPNTGQRVGVAGGKDVTNTGYYDADYGGHRDHVHTRQSAPIPQPGAPPPPPPPPPLSRADRYALATIIEGQRLNITPKGISIALAVELVETNLTLYANRNVPESLTYPHDAVGSDHDSTGLFQQRQAWGPLSMTMDPTLSAQLFFLGGQAGQRGLTDFDYNSDSRTPGGWAQAVQVSAFPTRYDARYPEAVQIYNRLSLSPQPPPSGEDDFLSALTPDEQRNLYNAIMQPRQSLSPFRPLGQGAIGDMSFFLRSVDGSEHVEVVRLCARLGHPGSIQLLHEIAAADPARYPDRQEDRELAQAILAEIANPPTTTTTVAVTPQPLPPPIVMKASLPAPAEREPEPEVLPAVQRYVEPAPTGNTPTELLETLERLHTFDKEYRQKFDNLTKESEEQPK